MLSTFHSKGSWRLWFTSMIFCWRAQSTTSVATAWEVSLLFTSMKASHCAKCGVFGVACHDSTWLILIQYASDKFPIVQGWTWLMLIIFHHSSLVLEVWSHGFWPIPKGIFQTPTFLYLSIVKYCDLEEWWHVASSNSGATPCLPPVSDFDDAVLTVHFSSATIIEQRSQLIHSPSVLGKPTWLPVYFHR